MANLKPDPILQREVEFEYAITKYSRGTTGGMSDEFSPEWDEYLTSLFGAPGINPATCDLFQDKERLFVQDPNNALLETWSFSKGTKYLDNVGTTAEEDLNEYLKWLRTGDKTIALNITQNTSWSRLKITFSMFARLCNSLRLMSPFLELVSTFGYRREDSDNYFHAGFRCSFRDADSSSSSYTHDLCYNLRYVDFHGRKAQDPWSFRNFSVYYRYCPSGHSAWIFINLPKTLKEHIRVTMKDAEKQKQHIALLHLSLFKYCVANWRRYINFLDDSCQQIRKATSFVRLDRGLRPDYDLNFCSCQSLGGIHYNLERSKGVLRSYNRIASILRDFSRCLHEKDVMTKENHDYIKHSLKEQLQIIRGHEQKIEMLLHICDFVLKMLFQLLSLRNDTASQENSKLLKEMVGISTLETKSIVRLSSQTCSDARGTKITTLISMAYAPAMVIAAIFSSNLIDLNYGNGLQKGLTVHKEIWVFTLATAALTLITVSVSWYLERRQKQVLKSQRVNGEE